MDTPLIVPGMPTDLAVPYSRVACIGLPDATDFRAWYVDCLHADDEYTHLLRGRAQGKPTWRTEQTYPDLRRVMNVKWIYVAYRGLLMMRHHASRVARVERADLTGMADTWADRMVVGDWYQWVFAVPQAVTARPAPARLQRDPVCYGYVLHPDDAGAVPVWT